MKIYAIVLRSRIFDFLGQSSMSAEMTNYNVYIDGVTIYFSSFHTAFIRKRFMSHNSTPKIFVTELKKTAVVLLGSPEIIHMSLLFYSK